MGAQLNQRTSKVSKQKRNPTHSLSETTSIPLHPDTRDRLIQVAKTLFYERGFDGTTVKQIADAAEVNISLISYHFNGKEGLYRTCLEQMGHARLAANQRILQEPNSREEIRIRLELYLDEILAAHLEEPELMEIINRECEMQFSLIFDIFKATFLKCYQNLVVFLKSAQSKKFLREDLDPKITASLLFGAILHIAQKDHLHERIYGETIKNQEYRKLVIQNTLSLFLNGFYPSPDSTHATHRSQK